MGIISVLPVGVLYDHTYRGEAVEYSYTIEVDENGVRWLYAKVDEILVRYQALVTDTAMWPSQFRRAVSWMLTSMAGPPLVKGDEGAQLAVRAMQMFEVTLREAAAFDAKTTRNVEPEIEKVASWDQRFRYRPGDPYGRRQ
jgi:hypothetical protein